MCQCRFTPCTCTTLVLDVESERGCGGRGVGGERIYVYFSLRFTMNLKLL